MASVVIGSSLTHLLSPCRLPTLLLVCLFHQVRGSTLPRLTSTTFIIVYSYPSGCGLTSLSLLSPLPLSGSLAPIALSIPAVTLFLGLVPLCLRCSICT